MKNKDYWFPFAFALYAGIGALATGVLPIVIVGSKAPDEMVLKASAQLAFMWGLVLGAILFVKRPIGQFRAVLWMLLPLLVVGALLAIFGVAWRSVEAYWLRDSGLPSILLILGIFAWGISMPHLVFHLRTRSENDPGQDDGDAEPDTKGVS